MTTATTRPVDLCTEEPRTPLSLRGVVLDVPDLLYDATLWRRWLFQLLVRLGVPMNYERFDAAWSEQLLDVHRGRREFGEALQSFLLAAGVSWPQIDEIEAASRIQRSRLEAEVRPLPGAALGLEVLAASGLPLAVWADAPITSAVLGDRLARWFPAVDFGVKLTSFDCEETLPGAKCYRDLAGALQAAPDEILFVGHHRRHLQGAREAGMPTVAIAEAGAWADHALARFAAIASLLPAAIGGGRR